MSDYEDFIEGYGYSLNDSDAFDKITEDWWKIEQEGELKREYEADLLNGKKKPKKNYHNSKIKKIGFNNFKPFGDKLQKFSHKPITLIYGPNSIGKSSFIHMSAYRNYIHKTKNLDLLHTDMFGDNINLGGFSKFIHKRDKDNAITLEYEFEDCSEAIIDYLDIGNCKNVSTDTMDALLLFSIKEIENIIEKSEEYITGIFSEAHTTKMNGYGSGDIEDMIYADKRQNKSVENLRSRRKSNYLCAVMYVEEFNFIKKYQKQKYIFSGYYFNINNSSFDLNINDIQGHQFLNKDGNFKNKDTKYHFISDVLIPFYINNAKLVYIKEEKSLNLQSTMDEQLNDVDINKIAKQTIEIISNLKCNQKVLKDLKKSDIALKISANLKYSSILDKLTISEVTYFINNEVFDRIDNDEIYEENTYENSEEFDVIEHEYLPSIFKNINKKQYNKIYRSKNPKNKLHEKQFEILFLSFKLGYDNLLGAFNDMLGANKMQYIGPLRFYPERDTSFKELDSNESIMPDSQTSWSYLKQDSELRENINIWLKDEKKLKTPYEIKYRKLYDMDDAINKIKKLSYDEVLEQYLVMYNNCNDKVENCSEGTYFIDDKGYVQPENKEYMFAAALKSLVKSIYSKEELIFEDLKNGTQISNRDLGLGISQILPILIATNRQKNTTIAIEQPELHLHPAVQMEVADEFIRSYKKNNNEFMIETHSEHILLRIMKRMRHTAENKQERDKTLDLTPDDVCLLYVDNDDESTYIQELRLSSDGKLLDAWPNGFFEEGFKERFS